MEYRDEIAMVCHNMMKSAQDVGAISETEMREFEEDCFVEESETSNKTEQPVVLQQVTA